MVENLFINIIIKILINKKIFFFFFNFLHAYIYIFLNDK